MDYGIPPQNIFRDTVASGVHPPNRNPDKRALVNQLASVDVLVVGELRRVSRRCPQKDAIVRSPHRGGDVIQPLARAEQSMLNYLNRGISDDAATLSKVIAEQEWEQAARTSPPERNMPAPPARTSPARRTRRLGGQHRQAHHARQVEQLD